MILSSEESSLRSFVEKRENKASFLHEEMHREVKNTVGRDCHGF